MSLKKLNVRNSEILIGLFILCKGLWLFHDSHYFIYPPQFKDFENSRLVDVILIVVGVLLALSAFATPYVKNTHRQIQLITATKVFLILAGTICIMLFTLQLMHGILTPYFRMAHASLGDLIIFGFVYLTACDA